MSLFHGHILLLFAEDPPSYDSIFGKIKHAKETSDGNVGFAKAAFGILCASGEYQK
jgi:hypothetical protein